MKSIEATLLHDWLKEDGSDGGFFSGWLSKVSVISKYDNQGWTVTIIERNDGFVLGGYSNTPWALEVGSLEDSQQGVLVSAFQKRHFISLQDEVEECKC